jgi:hypothetical protein
LQGLEQVLETRFALAFGGDIPRENTHTLLSALADDLVGRALEVSRVGFMLQTNAQDAGSLAPLQQRDQLA